MTPTSVIRSSATEASTNVVVNRLRTKLDAAGETTQHLIITEFRRGYRFVSEAEAAA
jgi:DNA-binding winged helix-turn-helix (wHTH) protein